MPRTRKAAQRRRLRGEGTVYKTTRTWRTAAGEKRSKTQWVAAVSDGYVTENGRRRRKRSFFYGATAEEARTAANRYLLESGKPLPEKPASDETTLSDFIKRFLREWAIRPRRDGKPHSAATLHSYENTLRMHVEPYLGKIKVSEVSSSRIKAFYDSLKTRVSPSMRARVHVALRVVLGFAREEGILTASPFDSIRAAIPRHKRPPVEPLNENQVAALLKAAKGHRIAEALITLALDSGMREGELIALRWEDIDFAGRKIHVQKAASEVAGEISMESPKSGAGRTIAISSASVEALKRRRRLAAKEGLGDRELVFPGERGAALYKSNFLRKTWGPLRIAAGIPKARFHDLRHTCATMLLKSNVHPKVVQERLGHSSITLTLDTYSASIPSMQAEAAQAIGQLLGRLGRQRGSTKRVG